MISKNVNVVTSVAQACDYIVSQLQQNVKLASPLGLGKPNQLLNAIYNNAKNNSSVSLQIHTALSLEIPHPDNFLEQQFVAPFLERHFGADYPELTYIEDLHHNCVPTNIQIHEFYLQAGKLVDNQNTQRNYVSLNYTHVAQSILENDVNIIVQLIAKSAEGQYSLSCNPDLTLDVYDLYKKNNKKLMMVGVVHPDLPFMGNDAEVPKEFFDVIVESPEVTYKLFALPRLDISNSDHMIGLYASQLVKDDGTLQIGIGSLSDAVTYSLILRQKNNTTYKKIFEQIWSNRPRPVPLNDSLFDKGLYGTSEMVMDGFMHLRKNGILKREVQDYRDAPYRYLHGAFFLGTAPFYDWLRNLSGDDFEGLCMTRVSKVNDLYDEDEMILRKQRKNARFFNTCMNMTLLGGAASETLENGHVVSGVGGQYNFIAMSHELPDSQSVLMLKSFRTSKGKKISNILWSHGHLTIPRHLRDIVVTEYGIANLRGKTDEQCIQALICIADSDFQSGLIKTAQGFGKLSAHFKIPDWAKNNTPENIAKLLKPYTADGHFPHYPFGSDFTPLELKLVTGLNTLKKASSSPAQILKLLASGLSADKSQFSDELKRMGLVKTNSVKTWMFQKLVLGSLKSRT